MNISDVQNILNSHGFPCGAADGNLGPATKAAVGRFQAAYCGPGGWLDIDGNPGDKTQSALQWTKDNNALVSFFSIAELACHHCGCAYVKRELLSALFKLRQAIGPVTVVDAYRCPEHNAEIKGSARNSQHVLGLAFDPVRGAIPREQAVRAGFVGIGKERGTNRIDHLDVRSGGVVEFYDAGTG